MKSKHLCIRACYHQGQYYEAGEFADFEVGKPLKEGGAPSHFLPAGEVQSGKARLAAIKDLESELGMYESLEYPDGYQVAKRDELKKRIRFLKERRDPESLKAARRAASRRNPAVTPEGNLDAALKATGTKAKEE